MTSMQREPIKFGGNVGVYQTIQLEDGRWKAYSEGPVKFEFINEDKQIAIDLAKEFIASFNN